MATRNKTNEEAAIIQSELNNYDNAYIRDLALIGLDKIKGRHLCNKNKKVSLEDIERLKSKKGF